MTDKTEVRLCAIHRREKTLRCKRQCCSAVRLSVLCVSLFLGVCAFLSNVQMPGVAAVEDRYGTVLLHDGAELYVLVGILAFVCGVVLTVFCVRWRMKQEDRFCAAKEKEETR